MMALLRGVRWRAPLLAAASGTSSLLVQEAEEEKHTQTFHFFTHISVPCPEPFKHFHPQQRGRDVLPFLCFWNQIQVRARNHYNHNPKVRFLIHSGKQFSFHLVIPTLPQRKQETALHFLLFVINRTVAGASRSGFIGSARATAMLHPSRTLSISAGLLKNPNWLPRWKEEKGKVTSQLALVEMEICSNWK